MVADTLEMFVPSVLPVALSEFKNLGIAPVVAYFLHKFRFNEEVKNIIGVEKCINGCFLETAIHHRFKHSRGASNEIFAADTEGFERSPKNLIACTPRMLEPMLYSCL